MPVVSALVLEKSASVYSGGLVRTLDTLIELSELADVFNPVLALDFVQVVEAIFVEAKLD